MAGVVDGKIRRKALGNVDLIRGDKILRRSATRQGIDSVGRHLYLWIIRPAAIALLCGDVDHAGEQHGERGQRYPLDQSGDERSAQMRHE